MKINKETNIIDADCMDPKDVKAYKDEDYLEIEPNMDNLKYDWLGQTGSYWNRHVVELLCLKYRDVEQAFKKEGDPLPKRSNEYINDIIQGKLT